MISLKEVTISLSEKDAFSIASFLRMVERIVGMGCKSSHINELKRAVKEVKISRARLDYEIREESSRYLKKIKNKTIDKG